MRPMLALTILTLASACSKPAPENSTSAQSPSAIAAETKRPVACDLVTAAEMSAIIMVEMKSIPDEEDATKCIYQPTSSSSLPMVQLAVDIGGGEPAMVAMKMMVRMENGELNDPLRGVGDQAFVVGPEAMIRRGDDLVRIMVMGTENTMAATKRIYVTASARLP